MSEVQDAEDILSIAAKRGYLMWQFRPVRGGMWDEVTDDMTLERGGYRNPPCPHLSEDFGDTRWLQRPRKVVYRFGRSNAPVAPTALEGAVQQTYS